MKRNLVGKILGKIKIFVQDFVPIRTALIGIEYFWTKSSELRWWLLDIGTTENRFFALKSKKEKVLDRGQNGIFM